MGEAGLSIQPFYAGWETYNERIVAVVGALSSTQLQIRPAPDRWPIWATIAHTAGVRVYWLCGVLGEPGAESTPFPDPLHGVPWEDDEGTPRRADELVLALETTWTVIDRCLERWTPAMLDATFSQPGPSAARVHTRQSVLMRLISHDAYHCGELSQTLGIKRLPQIDLWG